MSQQPPPGMPPPPAGPPPAMPPPPGGAPFPGGQVPMGAPYDAIEAIKYGWQKFTENWAPFVILGAVVPVGYWIYLVLSFFVFPAGPLEPSYTVSAGESAAGALLRLLISIPLYVAYWVISVAMVRGAVDVVDTGHTDLGQMFTRIPWLQALLASVLVGVAVVVGSFLCLIPGLIAGFLLVFTQVGVMEGQDALDAMRSSFELAKSRVGDVLIYVILTIVVGILVVLCTCGLAAVVVGPVGTIGLIYTWRVLQGRPVAA